MSNRFYAARFAVAALLFIVAGSSFAQETPLPAPPVAPPAAPPASSEPDTKTQTDMEKQLANAVKAYGQAQKANTEADRKRIAEMITALQNNKMAVRSFGYATNLSGARLPSQTISLDLKNVSARDAIAKVLNEAKLDYVITDDFPQDAKLSLSVSGVQVSTALDLITQSAGVRWAAEKRDGKIIVRVGKKVTSSTLFYRSENGTGTGFELNGAEFAPDGGAEPLSISVTTNLPTMPAAPMKPLLYQYRTTEQRSTFTCPRCGKKTTVVQKPGAKTTGHDDWHFCPYCGKKVADQTAIHAAPLWDDADDAAAGTDEIFAPFLPELPVFDTSFSGGPEPLTAR